MNWLEPVLTAVVSLLTGVGGSFLYFRPKLKEANANALKVHAEAQDYAYNTLVERMNAMEKMYNEQFKAQNNTVAELRSEILRLTKEKFANEQRIIQLEDENSKFKSRIDKLEEELQEYKRRTGKQSD